MPLSEGQDQHYKKTKQTATTVQLPKQALKEDSIDHGYKFTECYFLLSYPFPAFSYISSARYYFTKVILSVYFHPLPAKNTAQGLAEQGQTMSGQCNLAWQVKTPHAATIHAWPIVSPAYGCRWPSCIWADGLPVFLCWGICTVDLCRESHKAIPHTLVDLYCGVDLPDEVTCADVTHCS